jgi:hypothetical protein
MTKYYREENEQDSYLHYTKASETIDMYGYFHLTIESLFISDSTKSIERRQVSLSLQQYEEVLEESGGIKEIPIGEYELTKIELLVELQEKKYIHVG